MTYFMDSVELLVNVTPSETRIALVETGLLKEVHIERQGKRLGHVQHTL